VDFFISGSDFDSGSWSRSVMSNMTCVQNLWSIGRELIGFGISCRSWNSLASIGLNWGVIRVFDVV